MGCLLHDLGSLKLVAAEHSKAMATCYPALERQDACRRSCACRLTSAMDSPQTYNERVAACSLRWSLVQAQAAQRELSVFCASGFPSREVFSAGQVCEDSLKPRMPPEFEGTVPFP